MHPLTVVLNKIFLDVCLYIMYYIFLFVNKYLIKRKDYYIILKIFLKFIYFILFMNDLSACMSVCHLNILSGHRGQKAALGFLDLEC